MVKLNNEIVSKGYGPNKKESKSNAIHMLLKIMCPVIYGQWREKIKTYKFNINPNNPQLHEKLQLEERLARQRESTQVDSEMVIECSSDEKENFEPENFEMEDEHKQRMVRQFEQDLKADQLQKQAIFQNQTLAS